MTLLQQLIQELAQLNDERKKLADLKRSANAIINTYNLGKPGDDVFATIFNELTSRLSNEQRLRTKRPTRTVDPTSADADRPCCLD